MSIAKNGQAYRTKGHVSCQIGYDPTGDQLVNSTLISGVYAGHNAIPTSLLGGYIDGVGYVTQNNSYVWNGTTGAWEKIAADGITNALRTITYPHHEVHSGRFYRAGFAFTLANGELGSFAFTTPAAGGRELHSSIELYMTAAGVFTVYEDCTSYTGGAAVTPLNHNRNSGNATVATNVQRGQTGANLITRTGGTPIFGVVFAVARDVNPSRATGQEFIWKSGSKYVIEYLNSTSSNFVQLILEWYEHTPLS